MATKLMEEILSKENLETARKAVIANKVWCEELFAGGKAHYLKPNNTLVFYN